MGEETPVRVAIGLRAGRGGAVAVALAADGTEPRLAVSTVLATAEDGDRLAFEPYHVAFAMPRGADGRATAEMRATVAEGRKRQAAVAAKGLEALVQRLRSTDGEPAVAALLVNRAGWMTDLLEHSLSAPEHPPVAEGLSVRDALRSACAGGGLALVELDEKSLPDLASARLGRTTAEVDAVIAGLGAAAGRPWRKEQKLAALAAWIVLAGR